MITRTGITGNLSATAAYTASKVVGSETALQAHYRTGSAWVAAGNSINTIANTVTVNATAVTGGAYAMSPAAAMAARSAIVERALDVAPEGLFPNPATTETALFLKETESGPIRISFIDVTGHVVRVIHTVLEKGANRKTLPLGNLASGVYEVQVQSGKGTRVFRLIKQ